MFSPSLKNLLKAIIMVAICVALTTAMAVAQSTTFGAINGVVTDQSGAVISNAKVDVRNPDTNSSTATTSDDSGRYRVVNLAPGTYEVKVTASGFTDYKSTGVSVEVGRVTNVDAKMNVTGKGETIVVTGEAPMVNTEHQDFASNIDQAAIQNLPINGRRWSNYALLTPTGNPDGTFGLISFRGIAGILNNVTIDGGDNNNNFYGEERGRTRLSYSVSQDSVREFQVNTSNYSAEYGRAAGGAVNTVTKSGTNAMHGTGYWYFRDNAIGATNPSSLLFGVPYKAEDRRQQFGGTIGGPIVKDKAFFFFNYDQQKRNFPGNSINFTGTNSYGPVTVTATPAEPANGTNPALAAGACPTGTAYSGSYPTATTTNGVATIPYTLGNAIYCRYGASVANGQAAATAGFNFITSLLGIAPRKGDQLILFPKVDFKVLNGNWATSYNWLNWTSPSGIQTQPTNTIAKDQFGSDLVRSRSLNSIFNTVLGGNTALEVRVHWSSEALSGDFQTPIAGQPSVPGPTGSHPPGVSVFNWLNFGTQNYLPRPANPKEDQYQFTGNLLFTAGKHTFKMGGELLHQNESVQSLFNAYGTFNYSGTFAYADYLSDAYNPGANSFAGSGVMQCRLSTGVGAPRPCYGSFSQGLGTLGYRFSTKDYAAYVQDDFKAFPRLNLNFGFRYEYQAFPRAQFANPALAKTANRPRDPNNFGPRTGFAWDILGTGKLVVRGGYGVYFGRITNSFIAAALVGTGVATAQPSYNVSNTTLVNGVNLIYPNILTAATGLTITPNVVYFEDGARNPLIHESDAIVEYEFMKNTVASFSYLNSRGRGLNNFLDTNLPATYQGVNTFTFNGAPLFTVPTYGTLARPNAAFNQITKIDNSIDSDYNAYVVQVTRRMTNNWQLQSSYTYAKATDNGQVSLSFSTANNALDPLNPQGEYGRSAFDVPHKFIFASIWQPMFFKGEKNVAHYLLDEWTLAPIINLSSGAPFTGTISGNVTGASCASTHSGGVNCSNPGTNRPANVEKNSFRAPKRQTVDFRVSRSFGVTERAKVEFIAEAFNLFNHPNVSSMNTSQYTVGTCTGATPVTNNLSCPLTLNSAFGTPSTKDGGTNLRERQIQFAIRFSF